MAEDKVNNEPTLVERWLHDQQEWQRTALSYLDSMVKSEEFLVHMGNAMRGSLLAGKPYPTAAASTTASADDRLDQVLFALHQLQGQVQDLSMTLDELRGVRVERSPAPAPATPSPKRAPARRAPEKTPPARSRTRQGRK